MNIDAFNGSAVSRMEFVKNEDGYSQLRIEFNNKANEFLCVSSKDLSLNGVTDGEEIFVDSFTIGTTD